MQRVIRGRARLVGDHVNSDYIISSARKRDTIDASVLRKYLLEGVDPSFAASVRDDDILVAGWNFGCGSAMEVAATVILAAGIHAVVARSFARAFFRNAINNGLVPIECDTQSIREGDSIEIELGGSAVHVRDVTVSVELAGAPLPEFMLQILEAGGLVPFVRARGSAGMRPPMRLT